MIVRGPKKKGDARCLILKKLLRFKSKHPRYIPQLNYLNDRLRLKLNKYCSKNTRKNVSQYNHIIRTN